MRQAIAAACAALLVGLAPPGAFACASLYASAGYSGEATAAAQSQRSQAAVDVARHHVAIGVAAAARSASAAPASAVPEAPARRIWRAPSGPAPSRGPPA